MGRADDRTEADGPGIEEGIVSNDWSEGNGSEGRGRGTRRNGNERGRVIFKSRKGNYLFIVPDGEKNRVFCHRSEIDRPIDQVEPGDEVDFQRNPMDRQQVRRVRLLSRLSVRHVRHTDQGRGRCGEQGDGRLDARGNHTGNRRRRSVGRHQRP